jgi:CheY-like chemotaxis protein
MGDRQLDGLRILCVDDHNDSLQLLKFVLEDAGARVETSMSAAEAIERFRTTRPDILISDLQLPEYDGFCLMQDIQQLAHGNCRAIALSGFCTRNFKDAATAAGFSAFLAKPVDHENLIECILEVCNRVKRQFA